MPIKHRLDLTLVSRRLAESQPQAAALVMAGRVRVGGQVALKSGYPVSVDDSISLEAPKHPYVSRGGVKLKAALSAFALDVTDFICADVGASTGGFTDCLLLHGASKVYAIDVGRGQLARSLMTDDRVVNMEKTNARDLSALAEPIHLITVDVSFISLRSILPIVCAWLVPRGHIVALFKPQFEAGRALVKQTKGVIRDALTREALLAEFLVWLGQHGFVVEGQITSPIQGDKGNVEYLLLLKPVSDLV